MLVTGISKEATLVCVPYIYYLIQFQKDDNEVQALFNSRSEVNAINLAYAKKLGLRIWKTNVDAQKIDETSLATFGIAIASFQV